MYSVNNYEEWSGEKGTADTGTCIFSRHNGNSMCLVKIHLSYPITDSNCSDIS